MNTKKNTKNIFRSRTIHVKNSDPIASYFEAWASAGTKLYNSATFLNRNTLTGLAKPPSQRHPNQAYAIEQLDSILPKQRKTRWKTATKKLQQLEEKSISSKNERNK